MIFSFWYVHFKFLFLSGLIRHTILNSVSALEEPKTLPDTQDNTELSNTDSYDTTNPFLPWYSSHGPTVPSTDITEYYYDFHYTNVTEYCHDFGQSQHAGRMLYEHWNDVYRTYQKISDDSINSCGFTYDLQLQLFELTQRIIDHGENNADMSITFCGEIEYVVEQSTEIIKHCILLFTDLNKKIPKNEYKTTMEPPVLYNYEAVEAYFNLELGNDFDIFMRSIEQRIKQYNKMFETLNTDRKKRLARKKNNILLFKTHRAKYEIRNFIYEYYDIVANLVLKSASICRLFRIDRDFLVGKLPLIQECGLLFIDPKLVILSEAMSSTVPITPLDVSKFKQRRINHYNMQYAFEIRKYLNDHVSNADFPASTPTARTKQFNFDYESKILNKTMSETNFAAKYLAQIDKLQSKETQLKKWIRPLERRQNNNKKSSCDPVVPESDDFIIQEIIRRNPVRILLVLCVCAVIIKIYRDRRSNRPPNCDSVASHLEQPIESEADKQQRHCNKLANSMHQFIENNWKYNKQTSQYQLALPLVKLNHQTYIPLSNGDFVLLETVTSQFSATPCILQTLEYILILSIIPDDVDALRPDPWPRFHLGIIKDTIRQLDQSITALKQQLQERQDTIQPLWNTAKHLVEYHSWDDLLTEVNAESNCSTKANRNARKRIKRFIKSFSRSTPQELAQQLQQAIEQSKLAADARQISQQITHLEATLCGLTLTFQHNRASLADAASAQQQCRLILISPSPSITGGKLPSYSTCQQFNKDLESLTSSVTHKRKKTHHKPDLSYTNIAKLCDHKRSKFVWPKSSPNKKELNNFMQNYEAMKIAVGVWEPTNNKQLFQKNKLEKTMLTLERTQLFQWLHSLKEGEDIEEIVQHVSETNIRDAATFFKQIQSIQALQKQIKQDAQTHQKNSQPRKLHICSNQHGRPCNQERKNVPLNAQQQQALNHLIIIKNQLQHILLLRAPDPNAYEQTHIRATLFIWMQAITLLDDIVSRKDILSIQEPKKPTSKMCLLPTVEPYALFQQRVKTFRNCIIHYMALILPLFQTEAEAQRLFATHGAMINALFLSCRSVQRIISQFISILEENGDWNIRDSELIIGRHGRQSVSSEPNTLDSAFLEDQLVYKLLQYINDYQNDPSTTSKTVITLEILRQHVKTLFACDQRDQIPYFSWLLSVFVVGETEDLTICYQVPRFWNVRTACREIRNHLAHPIGGYSHYYKAVWRLRCTLHKMNSEAEHASSRLQNQKTEHIQKKEGNSVSFFKRAVEQKNPPNSTHSSVRKSTPAHTLAR